ncbi:MAG: hypothetical protein M5U26_05945 [Planctomycetota bacterium]|nr:hypothetical protein [Planctomycetota bacterium]
MKDTHGASAPCTCGQVVFDLSKKKPGQVLICPWCNQHYKLGAELDLKAVKKGDPGPSAGTGSSSSRIAAALSKARSARLTDDAPSTANLAKPTKPSAKKLAPEERKLPDGRSDVGLKPATLKPSKSAPSGAANPDDEDETRPEKKAPRKAKPAADSEDGKDAPSGEDLGETQPVINLRDDRDEPSETRRKKKKKERRKSARTIPIRRTWAPTRRSPCPRPAKSRPRSAPRCSMS